MAFRRVRGGVSAGVNAGANASLIPGIGAGVIAGVSADFGMGVVAMESEGPNQAVQGLVLVIGYGNPDSIFRPCSTGPLLA